MADEDPGLQRQGKYLADRAIECRRIPARKIGARGAVIGHEQRITDKGCIADQIGYAGGSMPRRVHYGDAEVTERQAFAFAHQPTKVSTIGLHIIGLEQCAENLLHLGDMRPDNDRRTGLFVKILRRRKVIGMGVRFEQPLERQVMLVNIA